jgi:hypothetical protein
MSTEISRRVTLAWVAAAASLPYAANAQGVPAASGNDGALAPLNAPGYGSDPDLTHPSAPWPLRLNRRQREMLRITAGLMLPADARSPSGATLGLDAFIDEWVSAPYPDQQRDRELILKGMEWLDAECRQRFSADFIAATDEQRRTVFDLVAWQQKIAPGYERQALFFARLRSLMLAGFFSLPEGMKDIGYMGNQPVLGPYPGPTPEALAHFHAALTGLKLT